jgi:hypothetical protein
MEIVDKIISIKGVKYLNNNDEINIKLYKIWQEAFKNVQKINPLCDFNKN